MLGTVYYNESSGFTVLRGARLPQNDPVVIVGPLGASLPAGETCVFHGHWSEHPQHGTRFAAQSFSLSLPTSLEGIERYLGSGSVPGVGPVMAKRIVDRFGDKTLDVIATQSARLVEVSGIGSAKAKAIAQAVRSRWSEAAILTDLFGLGLGPGLAHKVRLRYGDSAVTLLRQDPYRIAEEVAGIGFRTADRIGKAAGIQADDPRRAAGAILWTLRRQSDEGHTFTNRASLVDHAEALGVPREAAQHALDELASRALIVIEDEAVYPKPLWEAEVWVASRLRLLAARNESSHATKPESNLPVEHDASLSPEQRHAVLDSLQRSLMVLTGGPGTGKTTTVRSIVDAHRLRGRRCLLCAPTGRAARRLAETTGAEASTIHRLLEWNPATQRFARDEKAPLEADLVLVDETSMVDLLLAEALLRALGPTTRLVLVGDADQLPPIQAGHVLKDVIQSGVACVHRLTQVFRQAEQSAIVRAAHDILHGRNPRTTPAGERGLGDFFIIRAREPERIQARVLETLQRMHDVYGMDLKREVHVLVPVHRGPLGTEAMNHLLQQKLNPLALQPPSFDSATTRLQPDDPANAASTTSPPSRQPPFRLGDKVMQLRNDYDRDVYNGDIGEVRRIEGGVVYIDMEGREVQYDEKALQSVALAYASTIHKTQGSEFRAALIVLHASHYPLLSRPLLYTAVTRAKELVVMIGDDRALQRAIQTVDETSSRSRMVQRLQRAQPAPEPQPQPVPGQLASEAPAGSSNNRA